MKPEPKVLDVKLAPYTAGRFTALNPLWGVDDEKAKTAGVFISPEGGGRPHKGAVPLYPIEYTSWQEEELSWHDNCYIHSGLNPFPFFKVKGEKFIDLLNASCVSTFNKFPVGKARHAILCEPNGKVMLDGIVVRREQDEFICMCMLPAMLEQAAGKKFDIQVTDVSDELFFYQLCGPRSLEIVEQAAQEDLHDIKFMWLRDAKIAGREVFILRTGMAGTLGYEVHGKIEDARAVYDAIMEAGQPYGIHELGRHAYRNTHTEGSIPQGGIHFSWGGPLSSPVVTGSAGKDSPYLHASPVDLGWEKMVSFKHDFPGKDAIRKELEGHHNTLVHLIWDADDILKVAATWFRKDETPADLMPLAEDFSPTYSSAQIHLDEVYDKEKLVGATSGRMWSPKNHEMMSLAIVDQDYAVEGTVLEVLWGNPGTRQMRIKATVTLTPYIKECRNDEVDVESIPHPQF